MKYLPWEGYEEEAQYMGIREEVTGLLRQEVMKLSLDQENFLQDPEFEFSLADKLDSILLLMEHDRKIQNILKKLVPKKTTEEKFWKSYFSCVEQTKNALFERLLCSRFSDFHDELIFDLKKELKAFESREFPIPSDELSSTIRRLDVLEHRYYLGK